MGNGSSWHGSGGGSYAGSYGGSGGGGNGYQGFPYPGGASGWDEWSTSGGGGGKGGGWPTGGDTWGSGGKGGWDNNGWGSGGWSAAASWNESAWNGGASGKGRGKRSAGFEREEDFSAARSGMQDSEARMEDMDKLPPQRAEQDHRINGHRHFQVSEETAQPRISCDNKSDSGSDNGDPLPPPASEAEIEEARLIVEKAQMQAAERDKMKKAAKTATRDDLQAMINKRLAQK